MPAVWREPMHGGVSKLNPQLALLADQPKVVWHRFTLPRMAYFLKIHSFAHRFYQPMGPHRVFHDL